MKNAVEKGDGCLNLIGVIVIGMLAGSLLFVHPLLGIGLGIVALLAWSFSKDRIKKLWNK